MENLIHKPHNFMRQFRCVNELINLHKRQCVSEQKTKFIDLSNTYVSEKNMILYLQKVFQPILFLFHRHIQSSAAIRGKFRQQYLFVLNRLTNIEISPSTLELLWKFYYISNYLKEKMLN